LFVFLFVSSFISPAPPPHLPETRQHEKTLEIEGKKKKKKKKGRKPEDMKKDQKPETRTFGENQSFTTLREV